MKRRIAKLVTLGLSLSMIMGTGVVSYAANNEITDTRTFTIATATGDTHSYDVYQILKGDLAGTAADGSDSGNKLSNIKAGSNANGLDTEAKVNAAVEAIVNAGKNATTDSDILEEIEKYVDLTTTPAASVDKDHSATVAPGYYLIKDKASGSVTDDYDAYTLYIVKVAGNTTIERKVAVPTVNKFVKEVNDTTGETFDLQKVADFDIGDDIQFQLEGTLPENLDEYDTYKYQFNDTLSAGLTRNNNVKVTIDGTDVTSSFTVSAPTAGADGATAFTVSCTDLKAIEGINLTEASKVVVTYSAKLDTVADGTVLGSAGNANTVTLTYSNNPNTGGEGSTGETPDAQVKVYSYKLVINKTDKDKNALEGAKFILYKKDSTGTYNAVGGEVSATANASGKKNVFTWEGLDTGSYKLSETTTPNGYNTIKDITFDIEANFNIPISLDEEDNAEYSLISLEAGNMADADGAITDGALAGNIQDGSLTGSVVNIEGTILPTTGSTGLIVLIGGAVLIFGASGAVRMRKKEE